VSYLLDTDTCSAHLRQHGSVTTFFLQYLGRLHVSVITLGDIDDVGAAHEGPAQPAAGCPKLVERRCRIGHHRERGPGIPKSSEAYLWRGELHRSAKRLDAAIADFDEAIRLKPQSTRALIGRAFTWLMKGDRTKAVADTDRLVAVERSADNFEGRATVHLLAGNNEAATRDIEAGLRLDPHHPLLRPMQVMVLVASGVPEAIPADCRSQRWKISMGRLRLTPRRLRTTSAAPLPPYTWASLKRPSSIRRAPFN